MKVGFIGTGSMGGMLVRSLVQHGGLHPDRIWAANRSPAKLERLVSAVPGIHIGSGLQVARNCRVIFLCVKPVETTTALAEIEPELTPDHLLVLISNMVEMDAVAARVPARVAKVIPSVAQEVGGGVILVMHGPRMDKEDKTALERLLSGCGRLVVITESQGRICADLTSCGPAFLAYVLREISRAAAAFRPDLAPSTYAALVQETALATVTLLTAKGLTVDDVIDRVSVPGGITAEGLRVLGEYVPPAFRQLFSATHEMEEAKKGRVQV